jgi:DNA-directed RNA polymerase II subunit RPB1
MSNKSGIKSEMNPSKIIGIQFSLLSPEEIRKGSVSHITSRDTYVNNKPVINGLFDPRMGVLEPGLICPTDGLNYMETPGYFGHIELARPVFYIQYLKHILKILRCVCFKCSKLLINKNLHKHALDMNTKKRWDYVFTVSSVISRCGDENEDGCGCKQPDKIKKEGLASIMAEWTNLNQESSGGNDGDGSSSNVTLKLSPEMVVKIFRRISDDDVTFMGFSPTFSRPDWMICQVLAVPPPAVRPSIKHDAQQRSEDDISHIIINIIKSNKTLQDKIQQNAAENVIEDWTTVLQYYIATMVNNKIPGAAPVAQRSGRPLKSIQERLNGKTGRVRGNLMGKRVDFSSRSVITGDPNISIRELGVPLKIAMNITYPVLVNDRNKNYLLSLVKNGPDEYPGAKILERKTGESISLKYVDRPSLTINIGDTVHRHMIDGDAVLFNRQPTLHRMSMMCHIAKIMKQGNTFRMNVADTKPYNADYDGDEMNMHMPQDDESSMELRMLAAVPRQIISPQNNASIVGIFQDSLLGSYRITRENIKFTPREAMNLLMTYPKVDTDLFADKTNDISIFKIMSQILPPLTTTFKNGSFGDDDDKATSNKVIEIVNGVMKRGQLDKGVKKLLHSIYNDFGYNASADFIDNLQNIVTTYMKSSAYSVGISDLLADEETNVRISDSIISKKQEVKNLIDQVQIGVFDNNTGKSNNEEFETCVNSILNKAQEEAGKIGRKSLSQDNRFKIMVDAGSKGSNLNIAQMISCLGQQNVDGKRIPYGFEDRTLPHYNRFDDSPEARGFVESSFIQGLTPQELFFHAMGGRVGLIDTAVKTSETGYIQRRLIKGMEDLKVEYDMTVRNNVGKVIQFQYGDDGIDTIKVENQFLPLVKMGLDEIYGHYSVDDGSFTKDVMIYNFTEETIRRMNSQNEELKEKTKTMVDYMIKSRDVIIPNIFNNTNDNTIHIPVHFERIIINIKNQLNIKHTSTVDITPLECIKMVADCLERLNTIVYAKPTKLFEVTYNYYMSPKELLMKHRFNRDAMNILIETIITNYKKSIVAPGEMVGMVAAQSIGEPATQMTLNTFHFAGVSSKSNVTRGVPRLKEILSISENPKNPSVTVALKDDDKYNKLKAQQLRHFIEHTSLRDIVDSVTICYDPDNLNSLIEEDKELVSQYKLFEQMVEDCSPEDTETTEFANWVIRFEMNKEEMLEKNITMNDVNFALQNGYKDEVQCVFSDYNSDKLIFRIRLLESYVKKIDSKKDKGDNILGSLQAPLDQSDEIYMLKNLQENLLDNIVLRGIKNIGKVIMRKVQDNVVEEEGKYITKESWVLDTVGTNLLSILSMDDIDATNTFTNDIIETYKVLGIEAVRQMIYNEIAEVIEFDGTYINYHHIALLCDRMCCNEKIVAISRHGINNDNIHPIAKASFEETHEMFLQAARHAEMDNMRGVSSNVMVGQEGNYGTSAFQIVLDIKEMAKLGNKTYNKKVSLESQFGIEDTDDKCAISNIKQTTNIGVIKSKILDDDNEYNPGF